MASSYTSSRNYDARPEAVGATERLFPRRPSRAIASGRAILDRTVVHIPDVERDPDYAQDAIRAGIARSYLSVPMLRTVTATSTPKGTPRRGGTSGHKTASRLRIRVSAPATRPYALPRQCAGIPCGTRGYRRLLILPAPIPAP
jgi:hypothetical protein